MANIVVTYDANCIEVRFNNLQNVAGFLDPVHFRRNTIISVDQPKKPNPKASKPGQLPYLNEVEGWVEVRMDLKSRRNTWYLQAAANYDSNVNALPVDSINGTTVTDNVHLESLISQIILL